MVAIPVRIVYTVARDREGWLHAQVPAMPGCQTQGRSMEELEQRIRDAARLYYEALKDRSMLPAEFVETRELEI